MGNTKSKKQAIMSLIVALLVLAGILIMLKVTPSTKDVASSSETTTTAESTTVAPTGLESQLQYLNDIAEISWWKIDGNSIYIGFNTKPDDINTICNTAAFKINKELGRGTHVYAVASSQYKSYSALQSDSNWSYIYTATYRDGNIEK